MSMEVEGFDDVFDTIEALGNVGKNIAKKSMKNNMESLIDDLKKYAPRDASNDYDGADFLAVDSIKSYPSGSVWGKGGITEKNWEKTKHLLYQHYGYEHYKEGKLVQAHIGWMDSAFDKCKDKYGNALIEDIIEELDKVFK